MSYICPSIATYIQDNNRKGLAIDYSSQDKVAGMDLSVYVWMVPGDLGLSVDNEPDLRSCLSHLHNFVKQMTAWVQTLKWSTRNVSRLTIKLYLTPIRKEWSPQTDGLVIGPCQINSGETNYDSETARSITVWRREDFHKVLLHELLHAFDWDRLVPTSLRHNRATHQHQGEALVEACANILQCCLFAETEEDLERAIQTERKYAVNQVRQLSAFRWSSPKTHVYEYCILKTALLCTAAANERFQSWLSQRSVAACQATWVKLTQTGLQELKALLPSSPEQTDTISLQLVSHQLPVCF